MTNQDRNDADDLKKLGYTQELLRDMGGFSSFAISFSVISILTGISQLYGYGLQHGGPIQMTLGWWIVAFFTMTVALSMAELASAYPTSGALYHWSSFLGGKTLGWFTAWFNTVGQFAILAGIDYGLSQFLIALFKLPSTPAFTIGLYFALIFSHAFLNHIGIKIVSKLNDFSAWYHIGVIAILLGALAYKGFAQPASFLFTFNKTDDFSPKYSFLVGLLLSQWTLAGYDASAHVTEETHNPRKNAPWGIIIAVVISVVFGFLMLAAVTLSIPDLAQATAAGDGAFADIFKNRLGVGLGGTLVGLIAGAMWLCGLAAMTSASRMVYAFARDGGVPFAPVWAKVSPKFRTPANAIWALAFFATLIALSMKLYSSVVSVAIISLYLSYGLPVAALLYRRMKSTDPSKVGRGPWNLGRFSTPIAWIAVLWVTFISILFILPPNDQAGLAMGGVILILMAIWFFIAKKRFKGPLIQIKE